MKTFLITGCCGTGKTWVMRQLIESFNLDTPFARGLYRMIKNSANNGNIVVAGVYDGSVFEGSDRLSMAVMSDNAMILDLSSTSRWEFFVCEGDRFTNSSFIRDFKPHIVRIHGDGSEGRIKRGSNQSKEHLQRISSRVSNLGQDVTVKDSACCLAYLTAMLAGYEIDPAWLVQENNSMDMFLK